MMLGDNTENSSTVNDNMAAVEEDNKLNIEETTVNLSCVKRELDEDMIDYEEITPVFEGTSYKIELKEEGDNLMDFPDNVVTESEFVALRNVKEENENFDNFYCSKCSGNYDGYCLKCSTLSHILNNRVRFTYSQSERNTTPTDILEVKETSIGKGVFLLKTLPKNVTFGPFEGISGIESTIGHSWKIKDRKLLNVENSNWMKDIACAVNALFKNLDIFQISGSLYFKTNREIIEGEELLVYYDEQEIQRLGNSEECYFIPKIQEKLPSIFACTLCCLGFSGDKCLMEHKSKCPYTEQSRNTEDIELIECRTCKIWLEKEEYQEHHIPYCKESLHRIWCDYSEAVYQSETSVGGIDHLNIKDEKREYQFDMSSKAYDQRSNLQAKGITMDDYQCDSRIKQEIDLNNHPLVKDTSNERTQNSNEKKHKCSKCSYQTKYGTHLRRHLNTHIGIRPFECDICMTKFTMKSHLTDHIKIKHTEAGRAIDYVCSECSYRTNYKASLKAHLKAHEKPYQCDICMMKFTQKSHVNAHIKNKHVEDGSAKDYKCSQCSFKTNYKNNLKKHLNVHRGNKSFQCDICLTKFTQKSSVKRHIENEHSDNGIEKYKCSECSFRTKYRSNLKLHLNTHKDVKLFDCDVCRMKFASKKCLQQHTKNKHSGTGTAKDYKCSECSYQTNRKANLQRHVNTH